MEIKSSIAVVTGGGSGIGRAIALALAREGADVVVADVNDEQMKKTCRDIEELGRKTMDIHTDISKLTDVQNLFERTMSEMGHADILVNNAGVHMTGPFDKITIDDWEWIMGINLWGCIYGVQVFLPHFLERGSGYIVNTASIAGLYGVADTNIPYTVSKFGVVGLSEGLALFLRHKGVGVSMICPGLVQTNILEAEREIDPENAMSKMRRMAFEAFKDKNWNEIPGLEGSVHTPEDVAEKAIQAIKKNLFMVVTHSDTLEKIAERALDVERMIEKKAFEIEERENQYKEILKKASDGK